MIFFQMVLIIILISNEMLSRSEHMYCNVKLNYLGFGNLGVPTQGYLNNDTYSIQHKIVYAVAIYNT